MAILGSSRGYRRAGGKAACGESADLLAQGDLVGARKLHEEVFEVRRRLLGAEHPATAISAWNLFRTLGQMGDHAAAQSILARDLLWLLDRDPATLGADQREIQEMIRKLPRLRLTRSLIP